METKSLQRELRKSLQQKKDKKKKTPQVTRTVYISRWIHYDILIATRSSSHQVHSTNWTSPSQPITTPYMHPDTTMIDTWHLLSRKAASLVGGNARAPSHFLPTHNYLRRRPRSSQQYMISPTHPHPHHPPTTNRRRCMIASPPSGASSSRFPKPIGPRPSAFPSRTPERNRERSTRIISACSIRGSAGTNPWGPGGSGDGRRTYSPGQSDKLVRRIPS